MREKILQIIEKNSRIDLKELAIILGYDEIDVANEVKKMEEEGHIRRKSDIQHLLPDTCRYALQYYQIPVLSVE